MQFEKEAIQARDYCVANYATPRADRPDPSDRKRRGRQDDNREAIQARDYCVANYATPRADRPDPSGRKRRGRQDDNREAIQTRDYCVANGATLRADHPGPSARKKRGPQDDKQWAMAGRSPPHASQLAEAVELPELTVMSWLLFVDGRLSPFAKPGLATGRNLFWLGLGL